MMYNEMAMSFWHIFNMPRHIGLPATGLGHERH